MKILEDSLAKTVSELELVRESKRKFEKDTVKYMENCKKLEIKNGEFQTKIKMMEYDLSKANESATFF